MIDDQAVLRTGLVRLLEARFAARLDIQVAASCAEALRQSALTRPQLALLDADLGGEDGFALLPAFPRDCPVLVLTAHDEPRLRARALALGAAAFVGKSAPATVLLACISSLLPAGMQGEHPPAISGALSAATKSCLG